MDYLGSTSRRIGPLLFLPCSRALTENAALRVVSSVRLTAYWQRRAFILINYSVIVGRLIIPTSFYVLVLSQRELILFNPHFKYVRPLR